MEAYPTWEDDGDALEEAYPTLEDEEASYHPSLEEAFHTLEDEEASYHNHPLEEAFPTLEDGDDDDACPTLEEVGKEAYP